MRIAVDGYELSPPVTGVGRVTENLLAELAVRMPEVEFVVLHRGGAREFPAPNIESITLGPDRGYFRWQNGPFRKTWRRLKIDCLVAANYSLPVFPAGRSLLFVHDVSFASRPDWYGRRQALQRKWLVGRSLRLCDAVVTDSAFSRKEILRLFRVSGGKVRVVYPGRDERFRRVPAADVADWKRRRGIEGSPVIGYLGSIFNRRHVPELCAAVERLRRDFPDGRLLVVGRDLTRPRLDLGCLEKPWVVHLPTLPEGELPAFYSALDVFAYPSEYEGFGLPPLEALACGTIPVLLSRTSLDEVYRGAAFFADRPEPDALLGALRAALTDSAGRFERLENSAAILSKFNWKHAAAEIETLIRSITGGQER